MSSNSRRLVAYNEKNSIQKFVSFRKFGFFREGNELGAVRLTFFLGFGGLAEFWSVFEQVGLEILTSVVSDDFFCTRSLFCGTLKQR